MLSEKRVKWGDGLWKRQKVSGPEEPLLRTATPGPVHDTRSWRVLET